MTLYNYTYYNYLCTYCMQLYIMYSSQIYIYEFKKIDNIFDRENNWYNIWVNVEQ